ncbi:MAG: hypothetical protein PHP82_03005, partial [Candidatus ainarchaeum sp.]|nr:hypothetical protein [Candidatus ainarchaeum sp.]
MKIFDLIIWAVISIALLFIATTLFNQLMLETDLKIEIDEGLKIAETNEMLGKLIMIPLKKVEPGYILTKTSFDTIKRSIAIECTNPNICCLMGEECELIEWNYTTVKFKNEKRYDFFVRCEYEKISICRIYFGDKPAQAQIEEIEKIKQEGNNLDIQINVKNSGKISLVRGSNTLELYKKVDETWEKTDKNFPYQNIDLLLQDQKHSFVWNIEIKNLGEYRIKTIFEGENAGFDTKTFDFNIIKNIACEVDETRKNTIYDNQTQKFMQIHYCKNCNYSHECVTAWIEKKPD